MYGMLSWFFISRKDLYISKECPAFGSLETIIKIETIIQIERWAYFYEL